MARHWKPSSQWRWPSRLTQWADPMGRDPARTLTPTQTHCQAHCHPLPLQARGHTMTHATAPLANAEQSCFAIMFYYTYHVSPCGLTSRFISLQTTATMSSLHLSSYGKTLIQETDTRDWLDAKNPSLHYSHMVQGHWLTQVHSNVPDNKITKHTVLTLIH